MTQETFTRELLIERADTGDTFPVVLASETPVLRGFGWEVLDHSNADLTRAPLPLIEGHDATRLNIGVVEGLHVDGKKLRGSIRLGKSARAKELAEDIKAKIVRSVSIGYTTGEPVHIGTREGQPVYRFPFQPFELSLVAAPADIATGIFRSKNLMTDSTIITPTDETSVPATKAERERIKTIRKMGEGFHAAEAANRAIDAGLSIEQFRVQLIEHLENTRNVPQAFTEMSPDPARFAAARYAGMPYDNRGEYEGFSLSRLIASSFDTSINAGREREICQATAKETGRRDVRGLVIPSAVMFRSVTGAGSGGNLIGTDLLAEQFIDPLRKRMITGRAGATILNGLIGNVAIPRMTADVTVGWLSTDGTSQASSSDPTFDQVTMTPTSLGVQTTVSRKMVIQGLPQIEQIVRDSISNAIARAVDSAAINGTGGSAQPRGILATSGIGATTFVTAMNFGDLVDLEGEILIDDADTGTLAYVAPPATVTALKQKDCGTDTGQRVWTSTEAGEGRCNGYRAFSTSLMPAATVLFGNWSELLIGFWSGVDVVIDPFSSATFGSVRVTAFQDLDIAVRHPQSFAKLTV